MLNFIRIATHFSKMVVSFYTSLVLYEHPSNSIFLPTFGIVSLSDFSYLAIVNSISLWFEFVFPL